MPSRKYKRKTAVKNVKYTEPRAGLNNNSAREREVSKATNITVAPIPPFQLTHLVFHPLTFTERVR